MKQTAWLSSIYALAFALLVIPQGCGFSSSQVPEITSLPPANAPHPVTDLSQVAPGSPLNPFGKRDETIARRVASDTEMPVGSTAENLNALADVRHVGDNKHPGEERLLNKKAAQFDVLSMRLQDQVFEQIAQLQEGYEISHLKVPTDAKWVIITATLDRQGVLKELFIEQHSGMAAIDKMVIAACKKGLYLHNPPVEALDANGNYKVRIEARMENYASMDGEHWEFKTYMGLAVL